MAWTNPHRKILTDVANVMLATVREDLAYSLDHFSLSLYNHTYNHFKLNYSITLDTIWEALEDYDFNK